MAKKWSIDELILAFELYCTIPFGQAHGKNKSVIELAKIINRSPGAVAMKLGNFAHFDPEHQKRGVSGLSNFAKNDKIVWDEYYQNWSKLVDEKEAVLKRLGYSNRGSSPVVYLETSNPDEDLKFPVGHDVLREVRTRNQQSFFRRAVLTAYHSKCCLTGINIPTLLIASHIKPWNISSPEDERTNPQNGLCLNALHDKAFDNGLLTVTPAYTIKISPIVKEIITRELYEKYFLPFESTKISMPERYIPKHDFLIYHNEFIFKKT